MDRLTGKDAKSLMEAYAQVHLPKGEPEQINELWPWEKSPDQKRQEAERLAAAQRASRETVDARVGRASVNPATGMRYTVQPGNVRRSEGQEAELGGKKVQWSVDKSGKGSWVPRYDSEGEQARAQNAQNQRNAPPAPRLPAPTATQPAGTRQAATQPAGTGQAATQPAATQKSTPAAATTAQKIAGGVQTYKQQVASGDVKGAAATGKSTWELANPQLAAAAAERARIRGTGQTDNPMMADMKSKLPLNSPSIQSPNVKELGKGNQSLVSNPNAFRGATPKPAATQSTVPDLKLTPSANGPFLADRNLGTKAFAAKPAPLDTKSTLAPGAEKVSSTPVSQLKNPTPAAATPAATPKLPSISSDALDMRQLRANSLNRQGDVKGAQELQTKVDVARASGKMPPRLGPDSPDVLMKKGDPGYERKARYNVKSDVDLFDLVKGVLIDEGYDEKDAIKIMVNLDEGLRDKIIQLGRGLLTNPKAREQAVSAIRSRANQVVDYSRRGFAGASDELNQLQQSAQQSINRLTNPSSASARMSADLNARTLERQVKKAANYGPSQYPPAGFTSGRRIDPPAPTGSKPSVKVLK